MNRIRPCAVFALAVFVLLFAVLAKRSQYPDAPLDPHFGKSLRYEQAALSQPAAPPAQAVRPEFVAVGRVVPLADARSTSPDTGSSPDGRAPPFLPVL